MLHRWENQIGFPLENVRADLFGVGGRLEGLMPVFGVPPPLMAEKNREDPFVVRDEVCCSYRSETLNFAPACHFIPMFYRWKAY